MLTGNWNYPTPIRFGAGRITELPQAARELGMLKPLLVVDQGIVNLPFVARVQDLCESVGLPVGLFSDVRPNPIGDDVTAGVAAYTAGQHDGVIAMGGGSAQDVAKAVALMVGQDRPLWDFEDKADWWTRADASAIAPIVAVPTTSGTGSEVGRCSVIVDERDDHTKRIIFHPKLLPARVVADPELTIGLPQAITAGTGMDALAHNLEAFVAPGWHPMADGIAVEGIWLVRQALLRAMTDGSDIEARSMMMASSTMGATSFQKGLGGIHAMSHPIGAIYGSHHGTTNAVVMPYIMAFNRPAIEVRCARLARYLDLDGFDGLQSWILHLREAVGIPHDLAALGVKHSDVPRLAAAALIDPTAGGNPVPLTAASLGELFHRAIDGEL